ncbi:trypsin-like peptidase domain-containing protein [Methylorubrum sp. SL192]|uniref:trypsin-like peptidase domain-containing protein n=1 Tax=Methylorubrum sp. SL192 TaxID=2995167 RepID=UPI0022767DF1|nr:trypsin-like peptidase domain-containing protein [Methylorubrum sp. SL192]MCY1643380.1 trypsin-like peptidase domain-containing protein [Methylorubrum sp. SL192]
MLDAISLCCPNKSKNDELEVGSGFAYQGKNGRWIVTAAHIGLGAKPHEDWLKWADRMFVVLPEPNTFSVALFESGAPRFRHLPRIGDNQIKPDVIAVPITEAQWASLAPDYRLFTEADAGNAVTGHEVVGQGYPGNGSDSWPGPMQTFKATAEVHPARIRFDYDVEVGFSGGPLKSSQNRIVGVIDSADDLQRGYAWDFNFLLLAGNL